MLATMALVTSLALSAQAGKPRLSTAKSIHGAKPQHFSATAIGARHQSPSSAYVLDDGTMEDSVGFGNGSQNFESIWFNHFTVISGQTSITTVSVAWGTPVAPDPSLNGTPVTIGIWSDPNGDGNPSDAVLLGSVAGTIQSNGTDTFIDYTFSPPIDVSAYTSFFVGDMTPMNNGPENFPQGLDETPPMHMQSWVAAMSSGGPVDFNNLGNNDFLGTIDSFGLPGNWGIRADTGIPTPTPTPTVTPTPPQGALWYNGDFNGVNGLANEDNFAGSGAFAHTYDDFVVSDPSGWDVNAVFSDNLLADTVVGANWEIRQGVSVGNGGTIVASGTTTTPDVTATGRSGFGFTEYMVTVNGLSVHLDPGTYFLLVSPVGGAAGISYVSTTSGGNCVGLPCGNNDNSFFDSPFFGVTFGAASDQVGFPADFSMGVNGMVSGEGGITLEGRSRAGSGQHKASLHWSPAAGGEINVLRDGSVVATTANNGKYQDKLGSMSGTFSYQVCIPAGDCSNTIQVNVP